MTQGRFILMEIQRSQTLILSRITIISVLYTVFSLSSAYAETLTICTAVADASSGKMLKQEGDCDTRTTSASTFKIAISLMGFDAGFLKDAHTPSVPFKEGYTDWNPAWRSVTDPTKWIKDSVVWYSQRVTEAVGAERFGRYVQEFQYGNEDVSGDPGKDNGLTNAWLSSSLEISPLEQLAFLRKIVGRELPVSSHAYDMTRTIVDIGLQPSGWHIYGKTGAGMSKNPDGTIAKGQPWGWFVGWATKDDRTVVFARLTKDTTKPSTSPGKAARKAVLHDLFSAASDL
ncbi:Beta-lactamase OXA-18 [Pseudochrobactrum sp. MP213Fo]